MRLIDAYELNNNITERLIYVQDIDEYCFYVADVCSAIWTAPVVMQWISVNDELPPKNEYVLVYVYNLHNNFSWVGYMKNDEKWVLKGAEFYDKHVSHWMPLPKPPERTE